MFWDEFDCDWSCFYKPKKSVKEEMANGCFRSCLYVVLVLAFLFLCFMLDSCKSSRGLVDDIKDSVRVVVKKETIFVPDTVPVFLPAETVKVVAPDTLSTIETSVAVSEASISGGLLHHSIWNKRTPIDVEVQHKETIRDSIRTEIKWRTRTITKEVERKKTWWEQTKSYGFYALVVLVLWYNRKRIVKLIRILAF